MKRAFVFILFTAFFCTFFPLLVLGQQHILPKNLTEEEALQMPSYLNNYKASSFSTIPPYLLRNAAEWEAVDYLVVTWTAYPSIIREIVRYGSQEAHVIIVCSDSNSVKSSLIAANIPLLNISFLLAPFNSIWIRDYFANSAYKNGTDSLVLVDWVYNRPRPNDDVVAHRVAEKLNLKVFETATPPYRLVHTGGNFMSDGRGTGFSSNLVLLENSDKSKNQIDQIMNGYLGINQYITMPVLPYDGIHHIDMHMKLMNEGLLLVGEYPTGISDGPQIEANIQYILSNFQTSYQTNFQVKRIPMPNPPNSKWPSQNGNYYTYANMVFINKTILVPIYGLPEDEEALQTIRETMPGYKVVGINCSQIIPQGGAIHCITHTISSTNPLIINHLPITAQNNPTPIIKAEFLHQSGIAWAKLFYRTDSLHPYTSLNMQLVNATTQTYSAQITENLTGKTLQYYFEAEANSGKKQLRPITAPSGYFEFYTLPATHITSNNTSIINNLAIYPNPAKAITCIEFNINNIDEVKLQIINSLGQTLSQFSQSKTSQNGVNRFFIDASTLAKGIYTVKIYNAKTQTIQKLLVQ